MWQCGMSHSCFTALNIIKAMLKYKKEHWGVWLVSVWFAKNITSPCCQTSSDIGELFLNGLLWVVSVRVLKTWSHFSALKKCKRCWGNKKCFKKDLKKKCLQFPSGLFRSELEPSSVWDLRNFAYSWQASFLRCEGDELAVSNKWMQL